MTEAAKVVYAQTEDYGRKANLNITRLDIYCNKVKNIFRLLGKKDLLIKILENGELVEGFYDNRFKALQLTASYGKEYFLEIYYTNKRDAILICLMGEVPQPPAGGGAGEMLLAG